MNNIVQSPFSSEIINISELKGTFIKLKLGAKACRFRWHNKNKSGGNFGINILGLNGKDYEISGAYDNNGIICNLRFGYIYQAGSLMPRKNLDETLEMIKNITHRL